MTEQNKYTAQRKKSIYSLAQLTGYNPFSENLEVYTYLDTSLQTYLDPSYLGCSQEGQNSHIYAPRFGKYANRFSPSTIEKLSLIREARAMNAKIILVHKHRKLPELIDVSIYEIYEDPIKYVLDTREMKYETQRMFNTIKYGGL